MRSKKTPRNTGPFQLVAIQNGAPVVLVTDLGDDYDAAVTKGRQLAQFFPGREAYIERAVRRVVVPAPAPRRAAPTLAELVGLARAAPV